MPDVDIDLLSIERGLVMAPAGCGKTWLISDALARHPERKPILVLTHTTAGVVALRKRLSERQVDPDRYRPATLDGWALRVATMFPERSGYGASIPNQLDYPAIRKAVYLLLKEGHISDILRASYARLFVDEYQDCSIRQHAIVYFAATVLPTCILGDPLQAIFDFGVDDKLADWDEHVRAQFPLVIELNRPWRWINAGTEALGNWFLHVRRQLLARLPIDLDTAPKEVGWVQLDGSSEDEIRLNAIRSASYSDRTLLVIGDSQDAPSRHQLAGELEGVTVVEPVDLKEMTEFARTFDLTASNALARLVYFAETIISNVGAKELLKRVGTLVGERVRQEPTSSERAAIAFTQRRTHDAAASMLGVLSTSTGAHVYRPTVLNAFLRALDLARRVQGVSLHEAAVRVREQNRLSGRPMPKRAIGSTLLLKGLEAEGVVVLNGDSQSARNLYVAMTRGSKSVIVCSRCPVLSPA